MSVSTAGQIPANIKSTNQVAKKISLSVDPSTLFDYIPYLYIRYTYDLWVKSWTRIDLDRKFSWKLDNLEKKK